MNQFLEIVNERMAILQQLIQEKRIALKNAPEGLINIAHTKKRLQYYFKQNSKEKKRKYIKKQNYQLVQVLCQKDYDEKVIEVAERELEFLEQLQKNYPQRTYETIYKDLSTDRKQWVQPVELPTEAYIEHWQNETYQKKPFRADAPEYYTNRGERVRSKSEILIANILAKHDIPYKYECPLRLKGYGTIHPDFTVPQIKRRK